MKLKGKKIDFPSKMELSLTPLLKKMKLRMAQNGGAEGEYLRNLIQRSEVLTKTKNGISDAMFKKHKGLIHELMRMIFPSSLTDNEIKAVTAPWNFTPFYTSHRFEKIMTKAGKDFQLDFDQIDEDQLYIAACTFILRGYFKKPLSISRAFYFEIPNLETGLTHYYRLANNGDFLEIRPTDKALEITEDDYQQLINNYHDIDLWKKKFPVESWVLSGFNVLNMMDLTKDRILSKLTNSLFNVDSNGMMDLQNHISELLKFPVQISFVNLDGNTLIQGIKEQIQPLMLGSAEMLDCDTLMCSWSATTLIKNNEVLSIPDVEVHHRRANSLLSKNLYEAGIKSYFAAPVNYDGKKLGFLEIGSKTKGALNALTEHLLEEVMPVLAIAGNRFHIEQSNKIEAIIQAECTTIHPSVKWRFVEEAKKHLNAIKTGKEHSFSDIIFKDVHPLFGQLDIRNSSVTRNEAIKNDLQTQLLGARKVLDLAHQMNPMPLYEEMMYVLDDHYQGLNKDMVSSSEQDILHLLNQEVQKVLEHLSTQNEKLSKAYDTYKATLHPELNIVYNERKAFDDAVNTVNSVLSAYVDKKQIEAQQMFPHHFERYSTDGLEFNMYIGESISPNQGFHELMVKNLRLWQLLVMVELEREYHEVRKTLEKPLSVASLVLAYGTTLSIQYRMDEKNFDVEGAYNARYEIVKKRIDKAHIKGTDERITKPGKLVVVYSRDDEEREYLRYFKFLRSKGYLEDSDPELVQLEDLQGVSGLKAVRLGINYNAIGHGEELNMQAIINEIQTKDPKEDQLIQS